jgi:hypothetical protein
VILSALIATTNPTQDGRRFTPEALADMARLAVGTPANIEFDPSRPLGRVVGSILLPDGLHVTVETDAENLPAGFFVPHVEVSAGHHARPIERVSGMLSVALTDSPADLSLTKWEAVPVDAPEIRGLTLLADEPESETGL